MTGGVGDLQGTLAEFAAVDARLLAPKPNALSMTQAAALPLAFITAWEALIDHAAVREGQRVLVHGGAGGVGYVAIQLARARGAEVHATGGPRSQAVITAAGAVAIDYTKATVAEYVAEHTAGLGFDVVFDTVGGSTLDDSFTAVKRYTGHVVSALGWGTHALAPLSFRAATYSGVFTLMPLLTGHRREHHGQALRSAQQLADAAQLVPRLDARTFTFANLERGLRGRRDPHRHRESRRRRRSRTRKPITEGASMTLVSPRPLGSYAQDHYEVVAEFTDLMPTGVTVSDDGRVFVSFPRWGDDVPFTVAEVVDGAAVAVSQRRGERMDGW